MASIRLSPDVEDIAEKICAARGLDSSRVAIEAIVRCHWQDYLNGRCSSDALLPVSTFRSTEELPIPPLDEDFDAAAALDAFC